MHFKKKYILKNKFNLIFKKNLKLTSHLLFLTFHIFEHISKINTFDQYINYKSEIYLNYNEETLKINCSILFIYKTKNSIKNVKIKINTLTYANIC